MSELTREQEQRIRETAALPWAKGCTAALLLSEIDRLRAALEGSQEQFKAQREITTITLEQKRELESQLETAKGAMEALIARLQSADELHAVFTIIDSPEFKKALSTLNPSKEKE